jgi:hypothetical protein
MSKRDVIRDLLDHKEPSYVPWSFGFTKTSVMSAVAYSNDPL